MPCRYKPVPVHDSLFYLPYVEGICEQCQELIINRTRNENLLLFPFHYKVLNILIELSTRIIALLSPSPAVNGEICCAEQLRY